MRLADVCRQTESFLAAHRAYSTAIHLLKKQTPSSLTQEKILDSNVGLALCLRGTGNYQAAIRIFTRCLMAYKKRQDLEGQAYIHWALGTTERFAGELGNAEKDLRRSLALYRRLHDKNGIAYALCGLGGTLRMRGSAKASFQCYRQANRLFLDLNDRFGQAYSHCGQGNALRMLGKIKSGFPHMKRAEKLYRTLKLRGPLGFVLWSQAMAFITMKKILDANRRLRESHDLFRSVRDERGLLYVAIAQTLLRKAENKPINQPVFARIAKKADFLKLPFERAHALISMDPKRTAAIYRRCGVTPAFSLYKSLP